MKLTSLGYSRSIERCKLKRELQNYSNSSFNHEGRKVSNYGHKSFRKINECKDFQFLYHNFFVIIKGHDSVVLL